MRETELRRHAVCNLCKEKIGATHIPMFWVVKIERHGVKLDAVKRQSGLAMAIGSPELAGVMGPNEEMTMPMMDELTLTVCESCALDINPLPIAALAEIKPPSTEERG